MTLMCELPMCVAGTWRVAGKEGVLSQAPRQHLLRAELVYSPPTQGGRGWRCKPTNFSLPSSPSSSSMQWRLPGFGILFHFLSADITPGPSPQALESSGA